MDESVYDVTRGILTAALVLLFVGMGVNHFRPGPARVMARMIPPGLRRLRGVSPLALVYFTGVCEVAGGLGLALPPTRLPAAFALIVFLIAVFPANAYAARNPGQFGRLAVPFWPRLAAQLLLMGLLLFVAF